MAERMAEPVAERTVVPKSQERLEPPAARAAARGTPKSSPEEEALRWVEAVTTCEPPSAGESMQAWLRSGVVLCQLVNKLCPGAVPKIHHSVAASKQRENIANYLEAAAKLARATCPAAAAESTADATHEPISAE